NASRERVSSGAFIFNPLFLSIRGSNRCEPSPNTMKVVCTVVAGYISIYTRVAMPLNTRETSFKRPHPILQLHDLPLPASAFPGKKPTYLPPEQSQRERCIIP
ncbi:unnamed protein product, partial [Sphacelaria rigidula]